MENDIFSIDANFNLIVTTHVDYDVPDEDALDKIWEYVDSLKANVPFDRIHQGNPNEDFSDWDDYAKKGLIAYDNYFNTNRLMSKPVYPLTIEDIPLEIVKLLEIFSK